MESPIFLDHHSTTPIDPDVLSEMIPFLTQNFGNASSNHIFGQSRNRWRKLNLSPQTAVVGSISLLITLVQKRLLLESYIDFITSDSEE